MRHGDRPGTFGTSGVGPRTVEADIGCQRTGCVAMAVLDGKVAFGESMDFKPAGIWIVRRHRDCNRISGRNCHCTRCKIAARITERSIRPAGNIVGCRENIKINVKNEGDNGDKEHVEDDSDQYAPIFDSMPETDFSFCHMQPENLADLQHSIPLTVI